MKRKHISDITQCNRFPTESAIKIPVGILGGHWYKGQGGSISLPLILPSSNRDVKKSYALICKLIDTGLNDCVLLHTKDINNVTEVAKAAVLQHTEDQIAPIMKPILFECPLTFLLGYRHVIPQRLVAFNSCATTELVNVMKVSALLLRISS